MAIIDPNVHNTLQALSSSFERIKAQLAKRDLSVEEEQCLYGRLIVIRQALVDIELQFNLPRQIGKKK